MHPGRGTMLRGRLYEDDYKPKLSGHETFPLRYGWLKKAFDAALTAEKCGAPPIGLPCRKCNRTVRRRQEYGRFHSTLGGVGRSDRGVNGTDRSIPVGDPGVRLTAASTPTWKTR